MKVQEIIFDFDGVLVDSVGVKGDAFYKLYADYGESIAQLVLDYHLQHGGVSRYDKIRYCHATYLNETLSEASLQHWCQRFSDIVVESVISANWIPGALSFLQQHAHNYTCHIASATPQEELMHIVDQRNMGHYFNIIKGAPLSKVESVAHIIKNSSHDVSECVMIGDAMTDYDAAKRNNIRFIGVANSPSNFPESDSPVIPDLNTLATLIQTNEF